MGFLDMLFQTIDICEYTSLIICHGKAFDKSIFVSVYQGVDNVLDPDERIHLKSNDCSI